MKKLPCLSLTLLMALSLFATNTADFEFLVNTLPKVHKNFFNTNTEKDFKAFVESVDNIEQMSYMEFYYLLMECTSFSKDSHTTIGMGVIPDELRLLPIRFITFPDGIYIFAANKENEELIGSKLQGINGFSIEEIYKRASHVIPHDNDIFGLEQTVGNLVFMDFLKYIGVAKNTKDSVLITFETEGEAKGKIITPVLNEAENGNDYKTAFTSLPSTYSNGSYYRALPLDSTTYFIQYNTCQNAPDLSVAEFTELVIEDLEKNDYKKVVVDFRYNSGGNSSLFEPMMDYLKDKEYKLYGLIGNGTFSSSVMNALYFKDCGAMLVGTPTGGNVNGYGEIQTTLLPSGKYILQYSTKYFHLDHSYTQALTPDIYISTSFDEFLNGEDKEVEYCLND